MPTIISFVSATKHEKSLNLPNPDVIISSVLISTALGSFSKTANSIIRFKICLASSFCLSNVKIHFEILILKYN